MDRIHLAHDTDQLRATLNTVMTFQVTQNVVSLLTSGVTVSFARRIVPYGGRYGYRYSAAL